MAFEDRSFIRLAPYLGVLGVLTVDLSDAGSVEEAAAKVEESLLARVGQISSASNLNG